MFVDALENAVQRLIFDDDRDVIARKVAFQRAGSLVGGGDAWSERRQQKSPRTALAPLAYASNSINRAYQPSIFVNTPAPPNSAEGMTQA